ncbi:MAG: NlpC/P60 family protein [Acidimicrobiales bacterium]
MTAVNPVVTPFTPNPQPTRTVLPGAFLAELQAVNLGTSSAPAPSGVSTGGLAHVVFGLPTAAPPPPATSASPGPGSAVAGPAGAKVVGLARKYLGVPYVWGGTTPAGFDCSGLVQYVYAKAGINLPRTSQEQAKVGKVVPNLAQARPGDLVFFAGSDGTPQAPGHVGIYIGHGKMIDAPHTGTDVRVQSVGSPVEIRRVLPTAKPAVAGPAAPAAFAPLFAQATARYGLPSGLLSSVAKAESNYNPSSRSSAGALGIMQFMPATAASLGIDPLVPAQAIDGAGKMLAGLISHFRSVPLALAAYNAGPGAVEAYGGIPPYAQTQSYVAEVQRYMAGSA